MRCRVCCANSDYPSSGAFSRSTRLCSTQPVEQKLPHRPHHRTRIETSTKLLRSSALPAVERRGPPRKAGDDGAMAVPTPPLKPIRPVNPMERVEPNRAVGGWEVRPPRNLSGGAGGANRRGAETWRWISVTRSLTASGRCDRKPLRRPSSDAPARPAPAAAIRALPHPVPREPRRRTARRGSLAGRCGRWCRR